MRDLLDILAAFTALPPGEPATLATVVRVEGSSYRLPGARMLIDAAGRRTGAVSGGCLEADIARRGRLLTADHPAALVRYDGADEDANWTFNLGCNGSIEIFLERVSPAADPDPDPDPGAARKGLAFLHASTSHRRRAAMLTIFAAPPASGIAPGARLMLTADSLDTDALTGHLRHTLTDEAIRAFETGETVTLTCPTADGPILALAEFVRPPLPLVIFGAGHDAVPLVRQAKHLGWHVTLCDGRASYARRDRFPDADEIQVVPAAAGVDAVGITPESAIVIMTHHYPDDRDLLGPALRSAAGYVGLLGPRARADRLLGELTRTGGSFTAAQLGRLHAPIGLDLGAEGPDQVALSIVAEILAVARSRPATFLRDRAGAIHTVAVTRVAQLGPTADSVPA